MIIKFFKGNFLIIFAIFFAIPVIFLLTEVLGHNSNNYENIIQYGIETDAHVISGSEHSSISVNEVSYYSIDYYFFDENMVMHTGRTSQSYTYYQINQMIEDEVIKIKYLPDTYESIEANYTSSKDKSKTTTTIFLAVFGMADLILWIAVFNIGKNNMFEDKISKQGREFNAVVTGISSNLVVNGVRKYKVHYDWTNEMGENISDTTRSIYRFNDATALEQAKNIQIKAIGRKSIITTDPKTLSIHDQSNNYYPTQENQVLICEYCGNRVNSNTHRCNNCTIRAPFGSIMGKPCPTNSEVVNSSSSRPSLLWSRFFASSTCKR